jgi:DNA-directed RNA polymerase subunit RPC12/RpoP
MASCTICGVSFEKPSQVRAHIQGSGGEHAGIGFADAEQYISDARVEDDNSGAPPGGPPGGAASSPSKDAVLGVPQGRRAQAQAEQKDEPTCPECGSNRWFDASEQTDYEYGCANCSDGTNWQVFNA